MVVFILFEFMVIYRLLFTLLPSAFFFAKKSLYIKNQLCKIPLKISASTCISFHILADSPEHSNCHLLPYPLNIDVDGNVTSLESPYDCFLDTSAPVCGCKSTYLPGKLTT